MLCLSLVPGLVLINPQSLHGEQVETFQQFWISHRSVLKNYDGKMVYFDVKEKCFEPIPFEELLVTMELRKFMELPDPLTVPVLVNLIPKIRHESINSVLKETLRLNTRISSQSGRKDRKAQKAPQGSNDNNLNSTQVRKSIHFRKASNIRLEADLNETTKLAVCIINNDDSLKQKLKIFLKHKPKIKNSAAESKLVKLNRKSLMDDSPRYSKEADKKT